MKQNIMNNKKKRGMTLVELVIVLAIVAILASVALPSWNSQVQKMRRADARDTLILVQVEQIKYRADNGRYAPSMSALGLGTYNSSARDYYNVSIVSSSATTFVANAAPNANRGQDNDLCGTFAVDQSGPNESGVYAPISECW